MVYYYVGWGSLVVAAQAFLTLIVYQDRREAGPGQSKKNQKKINPTAGIVYMLRMVIRTGRLENSWSWRSGIEDDAVFSLSASRAVEAIIIIITHKCKWCCWGKQTEEKRFFLIFFFYFGRLELVSSSPHDQRSFCVSLCVEVWSGMWVSGVTVSSALLFIYTFSLSYILLFVHHL